MPRATFTLEDDDSGHVATLLTFEGGWNKESRAHQCAQMLVRLMDQQCEQVQPPAETPQPDAEAPRLILPPSAA